MSVLLPLPGSISGSPGIGYGSAAVMNGAKDIGKDPAPPPDGRTVTGRTPTEAGDGSQGIGGMSDHEKYKKRLANLVAFFRLILNALSRNK